MMFSLDGKAGLTAWLTLTSPSAHVVVA